MKHGAKTLAQVILILDIAKSISQFPPGEYVLDHNGEAGEQHCFFCGEPMSKEHKECLWAKLNEVY